MQYISVRTIFTSLVIIGCFILAMARVSTTASPARGRNIEEYAIPLIVVDGKRYFYPTASFCGNGFITCYESLDGVQVCRSGGWATKDRRKRYQAALDQAIIIDRGPRLNEQGQVVGERLVLVYTKKDTGRQAAAIFRIDEDYMDCIDGDSLEHVFRFEQWMRQRVKK